MKERTEGYSYGGGYGRQTYGGSGSGYGGSQGYGGYGQGFGDFWQQAGWQQQTSGYEEEPRLRAAGNYLRNGYYREARIRWTAWENMRRRPDGITTVPWHTWALEIM